MQLVIIRRRKSQNNHPSWALSRHIQYHLSDDYYFDMHITSSTSEPANMPDKIIEDRTNHSCTKLVGQRSDSGVAATPISSNLTTPICTTPSTPVQKTLLEIFQREQDHAFSLLESSPFLTSLFLVYHSQIHGGTATSTTQLPQTLGTNDTKLTHLQPPHVSLQAECDRLRIQLTQAQASVAAEIQRANKDARRHHTERKRLATELDSTKAAYAELKEDYEKKRATSDALTKAFTTLQLDHARTLSDLDECHKQVKKLWITQLEQSVSCFVDETFVLAAGCIPSGSIRYIESISQRTRYEVR
jgi:hypothetical protein